MCRIRYSVRRILDAVLRQRMTGKQGIAYFSLLSDVYSSVLYVAVIYSVQNLYD